ncbi:MAG TPA: ATP-binding protein [Streptosporangiaceae bacterium]|nr:ATP-binding protein [Streptosporangiaceae bacterium]
MLKRWSIGTGDRGMARSGPSDRALSRLAGHFAIALRLGSAAMCVVAGLLAAVGGVSGFWLGLVIVVLCGWSLVFAGLVWRHGPAPVLVLADVAVIVALLVAHRHVVPAGMVSDGTTWMLPVASTAVYIPQLTMPPVLSLPLAGVVAAAYVVTVQHPGGAAFLVVQAVVTAALMMLVRRAGRSADAVIAASLSAGHEAQAEAARRADEKEQYRRVHDTILATLTMIAAGAVTARSLTLTAQAARDQQVLRGLRAMPAAELTTVSLAERLERVAAEAAPLRVTLHLAAADPPAAVSERVAGCVAEALRNVARHAAVDAAEVTARDEDGCLVVEVSDAGMGFDLGALPRSRRGISESITGRMAAAGGTAALTSAPGLGTRVVLRWPG